MCHTVRYGTVRYNTVRYGTVWYDTCTLLHCGEWVPYGTVPVRYRTLWYGTVRLYGTVLYGTIRYRYSDVWICNVFTRFIRYFELSKNFRKVRVPGVMMRTGELGNTG